MKTAAPTVTHPCPECLVLDFDLTDTIAIGTEVRLPDQSRYRITAIHGVKWEDLKIRMLVHAELAFIPQAWAKAALAALRQKL